MENVRLVCETEVEKAFIIDNGSFFVRFIFFFFFFFFPLFLIFLFRAGVNTQPTPQVLVRNSVHLNNHVSLSLFFFFFSLIYRLNKIG